MKINGNGIDGEIVTKLFVNGKEYELTQQTQEENDAGTCWGCAFDDTHACASTGVACAKRLGEVYKEVK